MPQQESKIGWKENQIAVGQKITYVEEIEGPPLVWINQRGIYASKKTVNSIIYLCKRWLPGNKVKHISKGTDGSILVWTMPDWDNSNKGKNLTLSSTRHQLLWKTGYVTEHIRLGSMQFGKALEDGKFWFQGDFRFRQRRDLGTTMLT